MRRVLDLGGVCEEWTLDGPFVRLWEDAERRRKS
jgi:hypothetical protein